MSQQPLDLEVQRWGWTSQNAVQFLQDTLVLLGDEAELLQDGLVAHAAHVMRRLGGRNGLPEKARRTDSGRVGVSRRVRTSMRPFGSRGRHAETPAARIPIYARFTAVSEAGGRPKQGGRAAMHLRDPAAMLQALAGVIAAIAAVVALFR